jgi:hypothetical protein
MLTELNTQSQETGLKMNPTKAKILSNSDYVPVAWSIYPVLFTLYISQQIAKA